DSCPAYPVSTTKDRSKTPAPTVTARPLTQSMGPNRINANAATIATPAAGRFNVPKPTRGSFTASTPRPGSVEPRIANTTMMTKNGTASDQPGALTYQLISDSTTPSARAAPKVTGKDVI